MRTYKYSELNQSAKKQACLDYRDSVQEDDVVWNLDLKEIHKILIKLDGEIEYSAQGFALINKGEEDLV